MEPELRILDVPGDSRVEARLGDALVGFVGYRVADGRMTLLHTQVMSDQEGRGIGTRLASGAIDVARERGLAVSVRCPFIIAWLARHPDAAEGIEVVEPTVPRPDG